MSAEDRFDGTPVFAMRETKLSLALQHLWEELEAGYILHNGKYECGLCKTKLATTPREVKHDDGCIQPLLDEISRCSEGEVLEFAKAILHGDEVHRAWLLEAAEAFVSGKPLPLPRSLAPTRFRKPSRQDLIQ